MLVRSNTPSHDIQLEVARNEVIGFEPWEDFPFNRGMLCPKGVKRYLQGGHGFLVAIPRAFVFVGPAAWGVTAFGMVWHLVPRGRR